MDVSLKGEYALRAVFELAGREGAGPVKIAEIAARQEIPQKFLELILTQLKQGGFLASRRGADGGYFLAKAPETISVSDILRHIEGPIALGHRLRDKEPPRDSPFPELWDAVERALSSVIDQTSFTDLVARWKEKSSRQAANWQI